MNVRLFILLVSFLNTPASAMQYQVSHPCQKTEAWTQKTEAEGPQTPRWLGQFQESVNGTTTPIYAFSQAIQLKRMSALLPHSDFEHDFSEYWVGRILLILQLDPLAHQALQSVYQHTENPQLKKAAFLCMGEIQKRSPDWTTPRDPEWTQLPFEQDDAEVIFLAGLGSATLPSSLPGDGYHDFLLGRKASLDRRYPEAVAAFKKYFTFLQTHPIPLLARYEDDAHLFLGRAYYSVGQYSEASNEFQKIKKTSNQEIDAMNDLAWSYLMGNHYDEAIGISMQLRTGALKHTFSPEPMMVAAMALNELCLYPDSIRMIQAFTRDYAPSYQWLAANPSHPDLYHEVLNALKKQTTVPAKVVTEWMKSPLFLNRQIELNQLIEHPKKLTDIQKRGVGEQERLTRGFITQVQTLTKNIKIAKLKLKPGEELPPSFGEDFLRIKKDLHYLTRFYKASKIWKNLARNHEKKIPQYRKELVSKVNRDLVEKNRQLLTSLQKTKINTDLIEVEIYNGASQDMIWKNAHPDFEKMSSTLEDQKEEPKSALVWNWGRFAASDIENVEVWEDEMGTLKADISNQCSKQERYSQLKFTKRNSQ